MLIHPDLMIQLEEVLHGLVFSCRLSVLIVRKETLVGQRDMHIQDFVAILHMLRVNIEIKCMLLDNFILNYLVFRLHVIHST